MNSDPHIIYDFLYFILATCMEAINPQRQKSNKHLCHWICTSSFGKLIIIIIKLFW